MAIAYVIKKSFDPVACSPGSTAMSPGDLARLTLDTVADSGLPNSVDGVVQTPVGRERMLNPNTGCVVVGYSYNIAYDTEDLDGALDELTPDLVLSFGCVTCCQVLDEGLAAEMAARIAADETEAAARIAADETEAAARIAADETEAAARIAADETEAAARIAADETEAAARIAADELLLPRPLTLTAPPVDAFAGAVGGMVINSTALNTRLAIFDGLALPPIGTYNSKPIYSNNAATLSAPATPIEGVAVIYAEVSGAWRFLATALPWTEGGATPNGSLIGLEVVDGGGAVAATPDLTGGFETLPLGSATVESVDAIPAVPGTAAAPGQLGIYPATIDEGESGEFEQLVSFRCISTAPIRWEGATPGLFRHPDGSWLYERLTLDGSDFVKSLLPLT